MAVKAIETVYNGYRFRSRLEARRAVFFDAAGIKYQYEPEGFEMDDGTMYLPDFYLPEVYTRFSPKPGLYVEVKGNLTPEDTHKVESFCGINEPDGPSRPTIIIGDVPYIEGHGVCDVFNAIGWSGGSGEDGSECAPSGYFWCFYFVDTDWYPAAFCKESDGSVCLWGPDNDHDGDMGMYFAPAYNLARQARFEHGETPKVRRVCG